MKKIKLTQGKETIVDDDMFEYLNQWKWHCDSNGYAARYTSSKLGDRRMVLMHRVVAITPEDMFTDHINRDRLDNRKENLRVCTHSQNQANRNMNKNNTSGHRGVRWDKDRGKWYTSIDCNKETTFLGRFDDPKEAARVYEEKAKELFGEFSGGIN